MAKLPANGTRVWLDQFAIAGYLTAPSMGIKQETIKTDCLDSSGPRRLVGNYDHEADEMGFFDGDDDLIDEILHSLVGNANDHYLTHVWGQSAEGSPCYDQFVMLAEKPLSGKSGDAVLLSSKYVGSGGLSRGLLLANATVTGADNRTGRNQGAKASGITYRAIFRVISFNGTNITLKIQESTDDGAGDAYADVTGLTSGALTAAGVIVATTTAAMEAWRRVNVSGTFTSALIVVTGGNVNS